MERILTSEERQMVSMLFTDHILNNVPLSVTLREIACYLGSTMAYALSLYNAYVQ